jgi:DNA-binding CsgD family transcriptional regulator
VPNVERTYADRSEHGVSDVGDSLCERDGAKQLIAEVVAAQPTPQSFIGFLELTDVLLDIEVDGVRCVVLKTPQQRPHTPALTTREWEIARMVARGLPNKSMASVLHISSWTVSSHLRRMFAKLGVTTRAEMIGRLIEEAAFQPGDLRPTNH